MEGVVQTMIVLNNPEQKLATYIAKKRAENPAEIEMRKGPQSEWEMEINGVGAEIAFCKVFNIYPNMAVDGPDDGIDCYLHDGTAVDVKSTTHENGHLVAGLWKKNAKKHPDICVLVIGEFPEYRIVGAMLTEKLLQEDKIKDLGHGPLYAATQRELFKF
jgi:hypothetical protein